MIFLYSEKRKECLLCFDANNKKSMDITIYKKWEYSSEKDSAKPKRAII